MLKNKKGSLVVEISILLPLIIFMALSVLSMVLLGWAKMITSDAAREAARYVALNLGTAQTKVDEVIQDGSLKTANVTGVTVTSNTNYVTVTVGYDQPSLVPGLPLLFGGSRWNDNFHITSSSVFKKEKP
ncbi:TadE/TadG family type IV pilus assembly protein [Desulfotruncus alcoholivorax]|uniref:TadE/TadG family type IV pilus assembly protein n=1 Tax=Desulfotruncus alcoholivorax TaxID=265477 RepID=UPI0003FED4CF